ncbi:hypothetical protein SH1V18_02260 [Vallitalea longa]|uniref:DUF4236 domain-containing protein n=1 Tax=Vallitalea longa TaxID=2936439 RepID=A0A9W5Y8E9_9FIRM|nr:DUF4236 domain-containing protein [Vallitalea longa]GKX27746.1 hypothetical protein SH1V18_02260 [Vallitalea longa]
MLSKHRKNIDLGGGFHINMSKSGVGYSWAISGVSYNEENRNKLKKNYRYNTNILAGEIVDINSANIKQFNDKEYQELIDKISRILRLNRLSNFLLLFIVLIIQPVFIIAPLIGILIKILIHIYGKIQLDYNMDEYTTKKYSKQSEAWLLLNKNKKIWQIIKYVKVINEKYNAGALRNIKRIPITISKKTPFYLIANIDTLQIKLKKEKLIFLPDKIIIIRGTKVGAINYKDIQVNVLSAKFIESRSVPKDSQIVGKTWQYVNKNGTRDRRFKYNRQLPVCLYGRIYLKSTNGLNVEMECSNYEIAKMFNHNLKF